VNSSLAIANFFIQSATASGIATKDFPPVKVHGLVYLAHGWLLASAGAAIVRAQVMADLDGIFLPDLRSAGCAGTRNVTQLVSVVEMDAKRGMMIEQTPKLAPNNPTLAPLAWCWKTYGALSSFRIGEHIKEAGSPWDKVWHAPGRHGEEPRVVPNPLIKTWFRGLADRRHDQGRTSKLTHTQKREMKPAATLRPKPR
jgi:uncharacterized phage-associated protein